MVRTKTGSPEVGELLLCTVTSVQRTSVFVKFNEYPGKSGIIHISEISPGRIRNIRDYVVEGKVIVCKVLKVYSDTGHFDLSLRRVTPAMHREKVDGMKKELLAEKMIEFVADKLGMDNNKLYDELSAKILGEYEAIYDCFEDVSFEDYDLVKELKIDKKVAAEIIEVVKQRIKPQEISISSTVSISLYAPDGAVKIKNALKKAITDDVSITYLGSGQYKILCNGFDYKILEKALSEAQEAIESSFAKEKDVTIEFKRDK